MLVLMKVMENSGYENVILEKDVPEVNVRILLEELRQRCHYAEVIVDEVLKLLIHVHDQTVNVCPEHPLKALKMFENCSEFLPSVTTLDRIEQLLVEDELILVVPAIFLLVRYCQVSKWQIAIVAARNHSNPSLRFHIQTPLHRSCTCSGSRSLGTSPSGTQTIPCHSIFPSAV